MIFSSQSHIPTIITITHHTFLQTIILKYLISLCLSFPVRGGSPNCEVPPNSSSRDLLPPSRQNFFFASSNRHLASNFPTLVNQLAPTREHFAPFLWRMFGTQRRVFAGLKRLAIVCTCVGTTRVHAEFTGRGTVRRYGRRTVRRYGRRTVRRYGRRTVRRYGRRTVRRYGRRTVRRYGRRTVRRYGRRCACTALGLFLKIAIACVVGPARACALLRLIGII